MYHYDIMNKNKLCIAQNDLSYSINVFYVTYIYNLEVKMNEWITAQSELQKNCNQPNVIFFLLNSTATIFKLQFPT